MSQLASGAVICAGCSRAYQWKPSLAGKKGKCKCGEAIAFGATPPGHASAPLASPAASARNPHVEAITGDGEYDMVAPPPTPKPVARPMITGVCKSCQNPLQSGAVLCTRCGMNQATGKKISTKIAGTGPDVGKVAVVAGKMALSMVLGGVMSVICAVLWLLILLFVHFTIGYMAIGVGFLIGWVIRLVNPYGGTLAGLASAGFALFSLALVKGVLLLGAAHMGIDLIKVFSPFDVLWAIFAMVAAYRVGGGLTR